jgi:hypothetical protein
MCGLCVTEAELESNPARLGKGTSRLWDLILLGRDGMETETRRLVLLANHAALDGDSICLWLAQILAALPHHAVAPLNEVTFPSLSRDEPSTRSPLPRPSMTHASRSRWCAGRLVVVFVHVGGAARTGHGPGPAENHEPAPHPQPKVDGGPRGIVSFLNDPATGVAKV